MLLGVIGVVFIIIGSFYPFVFLIKGGWNSHLLIFLVIIVGELYGRGLSA